MSIAEKLQTIAENEQRVYDAGYAKGQAEGGNPTATYEEGFAAGKKAENDEFWDGAQKYGNEPINYTYAFRNGNIWNQERIEKVKYKQLYASGCSSMFHGNDAITDLSMFSFRIDGKMSVNACFYSCTNLRKCMPLNFDNIASTNNLFKSCQNLEEFIAYGTIAVELDLGDSPYLNKASITSVMTALHSTLEGLTVTFSTAAVNTAFETSAGAKDGIESAEWKALRSSKSKWNIAWR